MKRKIRSISIAETIDSKIMDDSKARGLTVSANISRILHNYLKEPKIIKTTSGLNVISKTNK